MRPLQFRICGAQAFGISLMRLGKRRKSREIWVCAAACWLAAGCGGAGGGSGNQTVQTPQATVAIYPTTATVPVGTFQPFQAVVSGVTTLSVTWKASAGVIDQSGNYQAPASVPSGGTVNVTATSTAVPSASASATVTITGQPVTLTIYPQTITLKAGFQEQFGANVGGTTNTSVNWSAADEPGDTSYPGSMLGSQYTAPSPLLTTDTYIVTAISSADPTKTASASVTVTPLENQEQQAFPIKLGTSGINANSQDCCSGTLGSLLADNNGKQYILSNNHVLGRVSHANPGENILQPGYIDTFCNFAQPTTVAHFTVAPPIETSNVDAAIAQVVPGAVDNHGQIIGLGGIASDGSYIPASPASTIEDPIVGMQVAKSGRTTGLSCDSVIAVNGIIDVNMPAECGNPTGILVTFDDQVIMGPLVRPGDSGSLIVDASTSSPVALVAALSIDGGFSTGNPITQVLSALKSSTGTGFTFVGGPQHSVSCGIGSGSQKQTSQQPVHSTRPTMRDFLSAEEIARATVAEHKYAAEIKRNPAVLGLAVGRSGGDPRRAEILIFVDRGSQPPSLPSTLAGFTLRVVPSGRFVSASGRSPTPLPPWHPPR